MSAVSLMTRSGLPPPSNAPVAASTAQTAPLIFPAVVHPPFPFEVQGVAMKTTPPAVTVGAERAGCSGAYAVESGPNGVVHEIFAVEPQPLMAAIPGGIIKLPLPDEETAAYNSPVTGE